MKTITSRNIMANSKELKFPTTNLSVYIKEEKPFFIAQIFEGRKTKPSVYSRFTTFEKMEKSIAQYVEKSEAVIQEKEDRKISNRVALKKNKETIVKGVTLRTSFSYNMTFNKFYRVVSVKGCTAKLEILSTEWVDGDIGWTGNVKAGNETGEFIEGKICVRGIKVDNLYGGIVSTSATFYENHMD